MNEDTYKGESLQKKHARYITHETAKCWMETFYPGSFIKGMHVFLASREGGDIGALRSLGVPFDNMLGADRDLGAIKACGKKWGLIDTSGDGGEAHLVHCEDVSTELSWIANCLGRVKGWEEAQDCEEPGGCWLGRWAKRSGYPHVASCFLDFCGHIDKSTVDSCTSAWRSLSWGSVMSVAFLKGREKTQKEYSVHLRPKGNRLARRALKSTTGVGALMVTDMLRGARAWDMREALRVTSEETAGD